MNVKVFQSVLSAKNQCDDAGVNLAPFESGTAAYTNSPRLRGLVCAAFPNAQATIGGDMHKIIIPGISTTAVKRKLARV